jgi:hypothetical protein
MTRKTLLDCTQCHHQTECDLHIPEGQHKHMNGPDPCEMHYNPSGFDPMSGKF